MNKMKINHPENNAAELRNLVLENPDLPIMIFCGEEAWSGEYGYEQTDINSIKVEELALYGEYWLDRDDYEEQLADDLDYMYEFLSEKEFDEMINKEMEQVEFIKAIVIHVG